MASFAVGINGIMLYFFAPASATVFAISAICLPFIRGTRTVFTLIVMPASAIFLIPAS